MRIDNSIPCSYNLSRKRGTPIDGAPSYTKLSEKITAKFDRLGGYFLYFIRKEAPSHRKIIIHLV